MANPSNNLPSSDYQRVATVYQDRHTGEYVVQINDPQDTRAQAFMQRAAEQQEKNSNRITAPGETAQSEVTPPPSSSTRTEAAARAVIPRPRTRPTPRQSTRATPARLASEDEETRSAHTVREADASITDEEPSPDLSSRTRSIQEEEEQASIEAIANLGLSEEEIRLNGLLAGTSSERTSSRQPQTTIDITSLTISGIRTITEINRANIEQKLETLMSLSVNPLLDESIRNFITTVMQKTASILSKFKFIQKHIADYDRGELAGDVVCQLCEGLQEQIKTEEPEMRELESQLKEVLGL